LVDSTSSYAVDCSPALAIGHVSHNGEYVWDKNKVQKEHAQKEIAFNRALINCTKPLFVCTPRLSVYHAAEQLCVGRTGAFALQKMVASSTKVYDNAIADLRDVFKPHRRIYQSAASNGTSPNFWTWFVESGEWGRRLGCKV